MIDFNSSSFSLRATVPKTSFYNENAEQSQAPLLRDWIAMRPRNIGFWVFVAYLL
jgi:hypothetical protein